MSMGLMVQAFGLKIKNSTAKLILLKLADNANDSGYCFPSIDYIAKVCEVDRRTVQRHIKSLEGMGFLTIKKRFNNNTQRSNEYHLLLDSPVESRGGNLTPTKGGGGRGSPRGAAHDHPESLDLSNPIDKTLCSSTNELIEKSFNEVWKIWPAKKNKIASKNAFKKKMKGKSPNAIAEFVSMLKIDVAGRLEAREYAFDKRNLEKWLKNELYTNVIEIPIEDKNLQREQAQARAKEASDRKARELFGKK